MGFIRRLHLKRRDDGATYLSRWGVGHDRIGKVLLHRMNAPDPGLDLHDHPWAFVSIILKGGYVEDRGLSDDPDRIQENVRKPFSVKRLDLDECHSIRRLLRGSSWSLIICGPRRREWGFYTPYGWVHSSEYDPNRRNLNER